MKSRKDDVSNIVNLDNEYELVVKVTEDAVVVDGLIDCLDIPNIVEVILQSNFVAMEDLSSKAVKRAILKELLKVLKYQTTQCKNMLKEQQWS